MSNNPDMFKNDRESIDTERRGLLVRFGLVAAAIPVLMTLSSAGYARGDDGGHGGDDGGHGGDGGGHGGDDGGHGGDDGGRGGDDGGRGSDDGSDDSGRGYGGDDSGRADRDDDDAFGHDIRDDSRYRDSGVRSTTGQNNDLIIDMLDDRSRGQ